MILTAYNKSVSTAYLPEADGRNIIFISIGRINFGQSA